MAKSFSNYGRNSVLINSSLLLNRQTPISLSREGATALSNRRGKNNLPSEIHRLDPLLLKSPTTRRHCD